MMILICLVLLFVAYNVVNGLAHNQAVIVKELRTKRAVEVYHAVEARKKVLGWNGLDCLSKAECVEELDQIVESYGFKAYEYESILELVAA